MGIFFFVVVMSFGGQSNKIERRVNDISWIELKVKTHQMFYYQTKASFDFICRPRLNILFDNKSFY